MELFSVNNRLSDNTAVGHGRRRQQLIWKVYRIVGGVQGDVALTIGSVPRRTVFELRQFD